MPRYKLLQTTDVTLAVPATDPAAPAGTKSDVEIAYAGVDADGNFRFDLPAYDTATHHTLEALHVSLYEKEGGAAPTIPTDPAVIVTAHLHYSTGCASMTGGGKVVVDATAAPEGEFVAALVAEFDA